MGTRGQYSGVSVYNQADRMDTTGEGPGFWIYNQADRAFTKGKGSVVSIYKQADPVNTNVKQGGVSLNGQTSSTETKRKYGDFPRFQPPFYPTGASFDVLHFFKYMCLVRSNNEVVEVDILKDKVVMVCFFCLPLEWPSVAQAVLLVSSELHAFGAFEIVLVITGQRYELQEDLLNHFLSCLPPFCIVAPVHWPTKRDMIHLLKFDPGLEPIGLLVNRNTVEWHRPVNFLIEYGVDAFPFTPERLAVITKREKEKDKRSWRCLEDLLCSRPLPFPRPSSFLRKNQGGGAGKVRLTYFENKCVGLYLCQTGSLIPTLDEIQKKCCDSGLEFEIILVYMPFNDFDDPKLFQDRINSILEERKISWWVLPFVNWVSRKLWRQCHKDADDRLIIVDHKSRFVELHGEAVIRNFGIAAYPFSRELLFNKEFKRLTSVTLESLLVYGLRDYILWRGCDFTCSVPIAALRNKNILLYLQCVNDNSEKILDEFISFYETKALNPDLEVVFVGLDETSFHDFVSSCAVPCLVCPFNPQHADLVSRIIFGKATKCSTIVAFRKDGRLFSLRAQQLACSSCSDNLYCEITAELAGSKMRDLDSESPFLEERNNFRVLVPLLEKEYFFPGVPLAGRMTTDDSDSEDEDERDKFFSSRMDHFGSLLEDAHYPNDVQEKFLNIDTRNFDVVSFLSALHSSYLLRNDESQTHYEVKSLVDKKWVMICCLFCPMFANSSVSMVCRGVSQVCAELYDKFGDSFEMVLVFKMRRDFQTDESAFDHMLSGFPSSCLFVPFGDSHSRDSICYSLGFKGFPNGIFVRADERRVIWHKSLGYFTCYGVDVFPFTDEDMFKITVQERKLLWNSLSLEELFCCPSSEILHEPKCTGVGGADCCDRTSVEQLKEKVVGVYLCYYGHFIPMLREMYECCKANNIEFEIVVVYCPFNARTQNVELFRKKINQRLETWKVPCRVLRFKSWVSLRLKRLCPRQIDEELIVVRRGIVDPHGEYFMRKLERVVQPEEFKTVVNVSALKEEVVHELKARFLGEGKNSLSDEHCCRTDDDCI